MQQVKGCLKSVVSTHSRLKAAGSNNAKILITTKRFNTQPPEGGWELLMFDDFYKGRFNTQPPEGGWLILPDWDSSIRCFNTQPPEGGWDPLGVVRQAIKCFNTQPPEGGWNHPCFGKCKSRRVSTHSRPKAAG